MLNVERTPLDFPLTFESNGAVLARNRLFRAYVTFASSLDFEIQIILYKRIKTFTLGMINSYGNCHITVAEIDSSGNYNRWMGKSSENIVEIKKRYKEMVISFLSFLIDETEDAWDIEPILPKVDSMAETLFSEAGLSKINYGASRAE